MPRKDGTPTSAERKDAERIEANRRWIVGAPDDELMMQTGTSNMDDPDFAADVAAELERRNLA